LATALRLSIFLLIELLVLPLQVVAIAAYSIKLHRKNRPLGISGTAYEPFFGRLLMHAAGSRQDDVTFRIAPHLPALSPATAWSLTRTVSLACRCSGYRGWILAYPAERPSSLATMVNHRTHFFDRVLAEAVCPGREDPVRQVVILGAGWDCRAYGRLKESGARLFEVDTPRTQQAKREALTKAGVASDHVTFVETDFNQMSWLDALENRGFEPSHPTFILWEGVTMYLDDEAMRTTLRRVARFAPGSCIAFDFFSRELVRAEAPFVRLGKHIQRGMKFYGETFQFGVSTKVPARDHVRELLTSEGLALREYEPFGEERAQKMTLGGLVLALAQV
jgi:methyltransferase (TIGR00027 family)